MGLRFETIGSCAYDCRSGLIAGNRSSSGSEGANSECKQADPQQNHGDTEARTHANREQRNWPNDMKNHAKCYRAQVDQRRTCNANVCGLGHRPGGVGIRSTITCHALFRRPLTFELSRLRRLSKPPVAGRLERM